jgi:pullulanase-type alpha-1,6-glucosidase
MRVALRVSVCLVALLVGAPVARANHTPIPGTVALVGSLQSELGCPGDWQPECPQTRLQPVAGSPGVFRATFDVPAGAYEYKVALNNSWDENYGAGGAAGGANIALTAAGGPITFTYDHATHIISDDTPRPLDAERGAHWLRAGVFAWQPPAGAQSYRLHYAPEGGLSLENGAIAGGSSVPLTLDAAGLPADVRAQFPHLASYAALDLSPAARRLAPSLLTGELVVAAYDGAGTLVQSTGVQIPGVLDDLYARARDARLGPVWRNGRPSLAVWAPTAKNVDVLLDPVGPRPEQRVPMRRGDDGVWRVTGDASWRIAAYVYEVTVYVPTLDKVVANAVTDPYSLALTPNSARSVLADLDDPALTPNGWERLGKPVLRQPEDSTIYELHVRDFSISDETVPAAHRGTYLAFTDRHSDGMRHLRDLARSGLNSLHLLPTNDIATIEEDRSKQQSPQCDLRSFPPDSPLQQECVTKVAATDGFNWGYDPLHYTTPEGSYATDPDGAARTLQFRQMVQGINRAGLRVIMDVVYNHTPAAGQDPKSILDRIVPGYYQRLTPTTGAVETSTCCSNTATEHLMMGKLLIDSVLTWARQYKVDGFRFDLMGHQPKALMVELRRDLDALTLGRDGVDGKRVYLYGEGWNFGEVADNARFVQASQLNLAGTGIGSFSDRLRDAVRGGGPFDDDPRIQGFASGLYTDPNDSPANGSPAEQRTRLLHSQDLIKLGLAGNLRDFTFVDSSGQTVKGSQVDYNGQPAGYAADPSETITYVDAHDNETLFDALQFKLPPATAMADRVRMNTIALATTALGQSPSFWHAGNDLLRSKSLDRNSFDSGDWFNRIDWSGQESTFGSGLPPAPDNQAKWPYMQPLLADPALKPGAADMQAAHARADELLRIRFSSPLFRLGSAKLIEDRVSFPNGGPGQTPGVIVMAIDDRSGRDLDRKLEGVVVVFNASPEPTSQTVASLAHRGYTLHPIQARGGDPIVRRSAYQAASGTFTVPARTVAVFVARSHTTSAVRPRAGRR